MLHETHISSIFEPFYSMVIKVTGELYKQWEVLQLSLIMIGAKPHQIHLEIQKRKIIALTGVITKF